MKAPALLPAVAVGIAIASAIGAIALVTSHKPVPADDWRCFSNLSMLQSVIVTGTLQHSSWDPDGAVPVDKLRLWWGPRSWPICPSEGQYVMPLTLKMERPSCTHHGDLLTKYGYPKESIRRKKHINAEDFRQQ